MGGGGKRPNPMPVPAAAVEVPAPMPTMVDESVKQAGDEERRRRANAVGHSDTVLTSGSGLATTANTDKKTLLGG